MATRMRARLVSAGDSEGLRIESLSADGYRIELDAVATAGEAVGPMELVLAALAGCTGMDVASILRKKRQPPDGYELELIGERATEHPKVFRRIVVEHVVSGEVEPETLRRSVELSATRYCPVNAMLGASVEIEHRYRLRRPGAAETSASVVTLRPPST